MKDKIKEDLKKENKELKDRVNYLNDIIRAYRKGMFPVQKADIDKKIILKEEIK